MVNAMCEVQLKDRKKIMKLILDLNVAIDQYALTNSFCCYGHVLRRENCHVLRRALDFEVEGQREAEEDMEEVGW